MTNVNDLRQHQRRKLHVEVSIHSDDNFYAGITGDVSEGGLFVATYMPPPVGTQIELEITLPNGVALQVRGLVRWVRDVTAAKDGSAPGCGIEFHDLPDGALMAIRGFVSNERDTLLFEGAI